MKWINDFKLEIPGIIIPGKKIELKRNGDRSHSVLVTIEILTLNFVAHVCTPVIFEKFGIFTIMRMNPHNDVPAFNS